MEDRPKSAMEFMPVAGSGESPASMSALMKQIGGTEMPVVSEVESKAKAGNVLSAAGV